MRKIIKDYLQEKKYITPAFAEKIKLVTPFILWRAARVGTLAVSALTCGGVVEKTATAL